MNKGKRYKQTVTLALLAIGLTQGNPVQASLVDRGNGLLYDNVLNVTWLQDANYAKTSDYSATGQMDWYTATTWATNLNYNGLTGWRLATNTPINGSSYNYNYGVDGTTDVGYNITSPNSELAYMYNVNLGLKDYVDTDGNYQSTFGVFGNGTYNGVNQSNFGQKSVALVLNLQAFAYWSGAEYSPGSGNAWIFANNVGNQNYSLKFNQYYVWAVRSGDVSALPVPGAVWLFGSGLLGLTGLARKRKATQ